MFLIGEPVLVYHNSANGEFSFVQGSNYYGWVQKDSIGLCTKEDQEKWINESSFILFTNETYIDGFRIRMGTRLPIIKEKNSHYIANFPLQQNHQLVLKPVIIGKSNEVNKGYLDYTEENIKQLAARLLGMPYGWGDTDEDMDCSSTIGAIFRCFGIILPRNTSSLPYTGGTVTDVSGFREEEKRNILLQQKVGSIFIMPGHVVMYMGEIDGMPMIFHNFTKYSKDGSELLWEYHADITALDIFGGSGLSYPSLIQFILNFR
ncbi:MAG: SH3 domain-containing protein [Lachnospiraceae bacterium]